MNASIRVLIAEDHPLFAEALADLLSSEADLTVVARVATVADLTAEVLTAAPDLAVIDLNLADGNALGALDGMRRAAPGCRLLVLTSADEDVAVVAALRAGAAGYLLKSAAPNEILQAIRTVASGAAVFDGDVAARIGRHLDVAPGTAPFPQLTPRERSILALMATGLSNSEIADREMLSLKTVRNNVSSIFTKLGVNSRSQAIVAAREAGLHGPPTTS
jgi:DNA-binding NarL/FixJ family response regulator